MQAVILAAAVLLAAQGQAIAADPNEDWTGKKVMPRLGAEASVGDKTLHDFSHPTLFLPWTVQDVDGDRLLVGGWRGMVWVDRSEALTLDEAPAYYTRFIESKQHKSDKHRALAYFYRAVAWQGKGDFDKAIADFDESIRLEPNYALAYSHRGNARVSKKEYDKAIADFNEAMRLDPNLWDAYTGAARLRATCSDKRFRDGKKAVDLATKACELSGWKFPKDINLLADAYTEAGDVESAAKYRNKALGVPE